MVVAVYFTNWSIYDRGYSPDKLPLDSITHLLYAFFKPTPSGEVTLSDPWADVEKPMPLGGLGCLGELKLLRESHGRRFKILASIGGWSFSKVLGEAVCDANKRQVFVNSCLDLVEKYDLDGVDLDWEYPSTSYEADAFVSVVQGLRSVLPANKELTLAVKAGNPVQSVVQYSLIDNCVSFYNVMAYDYAGPWSEVADHHAKFRGPGEDTFLRYYPQVQGIDPRKLVMGIPLYGRSFAGAKRIGDRFNGALPGKYEQGVHELNTLPLPGSKVYVDQAAPGAYCVSKDGLVSYDNIDTILMKADIIKQLNLGGGMFWEASGADGQIITAFADRLGR